MEEMWPHLLSGNIMYCLSTSLETFAGNYDVTFSIIMMILRQNI